MIRLTCSVVLFALLATVYSTDYFVEKFEGNSFNFIKKILLNEIFL